MVEAVAFAREAEALADEEQDVDDGCAVGAKQRGVIGRALAHPSEGAGAAGLDGADEGVDGLLGFAEEERAVEGNADGGGGGGVER